MSSQRTIISDLDRLVKTIAPIDGVVAIILFGSAARGEMDIYSDYDLLVIFQDRASMWSQWNNLFDRVGPILLPLHLIPKTMEEFTHKTEPTFKKQILDEGKILYMRFPFQATLTPDVKPATLITYTLADLAQTEKMRFLYELYGRRPGAGALQRALGRKLTEGCILVPQEGFTQVRTILEKHNLKWDGLQVYVPTSAFAQGSTSQARQSSASKTPPRRRHISGSDGGVNY